MPWHIDFLAVVIMKLSLNEGWIYSSYHDTHTSRDSIYVEVENFSIVTQFHDRMPLWLAEVDKSVFMMFMLAFSAVYLNWSI